MLYRFLSASLHKIKPPYLTSDDASDDRKRHRRQTSYICTLLRFCTPDTFRNKSLLYETTLWTRSERCHTLREESSLCYEKWTKIMATWHETAPVGWWPPGRMFTCSSSTGERSSFFSSLIGEKYPRISKGLNGHSRLAVSSRAIQLTNLHS